MTRDTTNLDALSTHELAQRIRDAAHQMAQNDIRGEMALAAMMLHRPVSSYERRVKLKPERGRGRLAETENGR